MVLRITKFFHFFVLNFFLLFNVPFFKTTPKSKSFKEFSCYKNFMIIHSLVCRKKKWRNIKPLDKERQSEHKLINQNEWFLFELLFDNFLTRILNYCLILEKSIQNAFIWTITHFRYDFKNFPCPRLNFFSRFSR